MQATVTKNVAEILDWLKGYEDLDAELHCPLCNGKMKKLWTQTITAYGYALVKEGDIKNWEIVDIDLTGDDLSLIHI